MKIVVYRDAAGLWRWRAQAKNGRVVADGAEGYASRRNARRAAEAMRFGLLFAELVDG